MQTSSLSPFASTSQAYGWTSATDYPAYTLPVEVQQGAIEALRRGETHYAPVPGIAPLRQAVAGTLAALGWQVASDGNLVITNGEQEARFLAMHTVSREGRQVAVPRVAHPGVVMAAALGQVEKISLGTSSPSGLEPTVKDVQAALDTGARVIYLESPNRFTGKMFSRDDIEAIGHAVDQADARVIWDQSLAPLRKPGVDYPSPARVPELAARCLAIGSLWPGLGLEDYSLGYVAGPEDLIKPVQTLRQIIGICTTTPAQWGAVAGESIFASYLDGRMAELAEAQVHGLALLRQEDVKVSDGDTTLYITFSAAGHNFGSLLQRLAMAGFLVASGESFGARDAVRLTVTPQLLQPRSCA